VIEGSVIAPYRHLVRDAIVTGHHGDPIGRSECTSPLWLTVLGLAAPTTPQV